MKTLKEVKIGESATIKRLHGEGALSGASWTWA